jgi:hypothetical protein
MARRSVNLGAATGTGAGAALDVPDNNLDDLSVFIFGTFSGTMTIEASCDGTNFVPLKDRGGTAISTTAPAMFALSGSATHIRRNCTAYSSGTIQSVLCE